MENESWAIASIRFHPAQHKKVARAAKRQKKSIAHIIRELVDKHVK